MVCCENCLVVCDVLPCGELLTVGTIAAATDVNVYIKNVATKREQVQQVTSDGAGLVEIAMNDPSPYFYAAGADYQIWMTETTSQNKSSAMEFEVVGDATLAGTNTDTRCVLVTFRHAFVGSDVIETSQILTARP